MLAVTVRDYHEADEAAVCQVEADAVATLRRCYHPRPARAAQRLRARAYLVAVAEGDIVGSVGYEWRRGWLHLVGLGVLDAWRRRGIARALVDHLAQHARRQHARGLTLETVEQTGNVAIFERLGFIAVRRRPARDLESERFATLTTVTMQREVSSC